MIPIDVYRIGTQPAWWRRHTSRFGPRWANHWRLYRLIDRAMPRKVAGRWLGPTWQAEWPDCPRAARARTERGARRAALKAIAG